MRDNNTGFKRKKKSLFFRNQYILTGFMNFVICNFVTKHSMETRFIQIINLRVHHNSSLTQKRNSRDAIFLNVHYAGALAISKERGTLCILKR